MWIYNTFLIHSVFLGLFRGNCRVKKHFRVDKKINRMRIIIFSSNCSTHSHLMFRDFINCYLSGPTGRDEGWDSDLIRMTKQQQSAVTDRPKRNLWCYSICRMRSSWADPQRLWIWAPFLSTVKAYHPIVAAAE